MSENFIRHLISAIGLLVTLFAYMAGYISGGLKWWWTSIVLLVIYWAIYKLVDVSHH